MALSEIKQGFGIVTVINAKCVSVQAINATLDDKTWDDYCKENLPEDCAKKALTVYNAKKGTDDACFIDTLKIANIAVEGPSKTITGGQYANPLIKFGKTATCSMQDALGHPDALKLLAGVEIETTNHMHFTSKFGKPVVIIGETYVIDRESGEQVDVIELIYNFLPDSIISLTQESEGDATVFDLNGSLGATDVLKTAAEGQTPATYYHGTFYSIIDPEPTPTTYTLTVNAGGGTYSGEAIVTDDEGNFTAPAASTITPPSEKTLSGFKLNGEGNLILAEGTGTASADGTLVAVYSE